MVLVNTSVITQCMYCSAQRQGPWLLLPLSSLSFIGYVYDLFVCFDFVCNANILMTLRYVYLYNMSLRLLGF